MDELKIKNYDVFIARMLQLIISFLSSYIALVLIALVVYGRFIDPEEYFVGVLLFEYKPIGLAVAWGVTGVVATILIKRSMGQKIRGTVVMKKWIGLKNWVLSLGQDFE